MPNTPALVGEGMTGATPNEFVTEAELKYVCEILSGFSKVEVISEKLMDTVSCSKRKFSGICIYVY